MSLNKSSMRETERDRISCKAKVDSDVKEVKVWLAKWEAVAHFQ